MSEQDNAGLWRFWCDKALKLTEVNGELRKEIEAQAAQLQEAREVMRSICFPGVRIYYNRDGHEEAVLKLRAFLAKSQ
jgi:hypothetical protein